MAINDFIDIASEEGVVQIPSRLQEYELDACVRDARNIVKEVRLGQVRAAARLGPRNSRRFRVPVDHSVSFSSNVSFDPGELRVERRQGPPDLHAAVLSFPARLLIYVNEKCDGIAPIAYKRAGISRQIYSRIVSSDSSVVDKRTAMLLCIGLQLEMSEAELLMRAAGFAFSATLPEDRVFAYCIDKKIWNIEDVNDIMLRSGLKPLLH